MKTQSSMSDKTAAADKTGLFKAVIALDGTPHSTLVVENLHHYLKSPEANCQFLYVLPSPPTGEQKFSALDDEAREEITRVVNQQFDRYAGTLAGNNLVVSDRQFVKDADSIEEGILNTVEANPTDLLVLGMHETSPSRRKWRISSTSYAIATQAPCSVLVMKRPAKAGSRLKVLYCTDGSSHAQKALDEMIRYLPAETTDVVVLNVVSVNYYVLPIAEPYVNYGPLQHAMQGEALELLQNVRTTLQNAGFNVLDAYFNLGDPVDQIMGEANKIHADLVVVGSHGVSGRLTKWLLGSVSSKLLEYCESSVAIFR